MPAAALLELDAQGAAPPDLRAYLKRQSVDFLVDMILGHAEENTELWRRLQLAASVSDADGDALAARLRRLVDQVTDVPYYVDYRGAADWAAEVDHVLDALADLAASPRAHLAIELAERAIDRVGEAIENIDDSNGCCGALLERGRDIHLAACRTSRPDPIELARNLFDREMEDDWGTFDGVMEAYQDVLGEEGLGEYRRLASDAWATAAPGSGANGDRASEIPRGRLRPILDYFAARDGDLETRIALRSSDLSSTGHYLRLAQFCVEHGRGNEAMQRAEEGLWLFEDARPDERLLFFTVDLLTKAKRADDAVSHLWRAFEKAPSLEIYRRLTAIGGQVHAERARARLEVRAPGERSTQWYSRGDLLIRVLMHELDYRSAWDAAQRLGVSRDLKLSLARASASQFPSEALTVYTERVEELVTQGGNQSYDDANALVSAMAPLRTAAEQAAYIADLKLRHKRKRNFMKLLG
jgi:tetratricopeptide (TPR) repeat protein